MSGLLNISIIGAGQIGSRHLQALANLKNTVRIQLVDKSKDSIEVALNRFQDVYKGDANRITLQHFSSIQDLEKYQDLVIVATDASHRYDLVKELVQTKNVRSMILEKVLFQKENEYYEIDCLLKNKKIPTWVNCVLRATDFYRGIKSTLNKNKPIRMTVEGDSWGLACNSIHFMDLLSFFSDCRDFEFTKVELDKKIYDSRRSACKEFSGKLVGKNSQGHSLSLSCKSGECEEADKGGPILIQIDNDNKKHVITSYLGRAIYKIITESEEIEKTVVLPMQSQLTHLLAKNIFQNDTCDLPSYRDSMVLHLCLIKVLLEQISQIKGKVIKRCPIT